MREIHDPEVTIPTMQSLLAGEKKKRRRVMLWMLFDAFNYKNVNPDYY